MDGVKHWSTLIMARKAVLITSVITTVEILEGNSPAGLKAQFDSLFNRSNIIRYDVNPRIAEKAHDLRDYYDVRRNKSAGEPQLCIADALHLATAIIYRAEEFHTFGSHGQKGCMGLIPLSGNVGGHQLTVCAPKAPPQEQQSLFEMNKPPEAGS